MQLFISPGACCLGAHVIVHELDLPVDVVSVPLRTPDSPIHGVNPLGRVPALRLADGTVITENSAILPLLADQRPGTSLFAPVGNPDARRSSPGSAISAPRCTSGVSGRSIGPSATRTTRLRIPASVNEVASSC